MSASTVFALGLAFLVGTPAFTDQAGGPVEREEFTSREGGHIVTVDPNWNESGDDIDPEISLRTRDGRQIWTRKPTDFQDFYYPLHVSVSDDGRFLVFATSSVHNMIDDEHYREGVRIYRRDGTLVRFISRRDLRPGHYGVSSASWFDYGRSRISDNHYYLFTPGKADPVILDLSSGGVVRGRIIPGQGDDSNWDLLTRMRRSRKR